MATSLPRRILRAIAPAARAELQAFWRRHGVDERMVFLESFDGNGTLCNPEAIFRALLEDPEFNHLRFVWSLKPGHERDRLPHEFSEHPRVRFVTPGTSGYTRALATAGYLVTNSTFPRWFARRPRQVVLNTWHGTPLKKMGFDIDDQPARVANVLRNLLHADYLLSSGPDMTDTMYRRAHKLEGLYDGRVLEVGSPRVDVQFAAAGALDETRLALATAGVEVGDRELVLFAPTWKGRSFLRPDGEVEATIARVRDLQERLGDRYLVALKPHQSVASRFRMLEPSVPLVPNDLPTNAVLAVTDHLVTDYSSIFFDFLTTGRPIHFFVPDVEDYSDYRGLYLDPMTLPGRVCLSVPSLVAALTTPEPDDFLARRGAARELFAGAEDGHATQRVVDIVFGGKAVGSSAGLDGAGAPRVVLVVGGPPGVWDPARFEQEIKGFDLDAVDVTVLVSDSRRREFVDWQRGLDPRIRVLVRQGVLPGSKIWAAGARLTGRRPRSQWREEWTRMLGLSRVDTVTSLTSDPAWVPLADAGRSIGRRPPFTS